MKIKIISLIVFLLLPACLLNAQIQIGSNEIAAMNRAGKIAGDDMAALKKTITLFTLPYKDYDRLEQFEQAIKSVWTITPFRIIRPEEMSGYINKEGYSVFSFGGYMVQRQGGLANPANMHLAYDLWMPEKKKNGSMRQLYFARILIYPDNQSFFTAMKSSNKKNADFSGQMISFIYNDAVIYNWGPGFLKGYLYTVNEYLSGNEERGPYSEEEDEQALKSLRTDTLYIPEYVRVKFNPFTGAENAEENSDEDIINAYPFPVKFISDEMLNRLILQGKAVKYLVYTKSSSDKYINIFDSSNGKLLYARYSKLSYNFKNKDLTKLARLID